MSRILSVLFGPSQAHAKGVSDALGDLTEFSSSPPPPGRGEPRPREIGADTIAFLTADGTVVCAIDADAVTCAAVAEPLRGVRVAGTATAVALETPLLDRAALDRPETRFVEHLTTARRDVPRGGRTYAGLASGTTVGNDAIRVEVGEGKLTISHLPSGHREVFLSER